MKFFPFDPLFTLNGLRDFYRQMTPHSTRNHLWIHFMILKNHYDVISHVID